jgi:hypothetical protein
MTKTLEPSFLQYRRNYSENPCRRACRDKTRHCCRIVSFLVLVWGGGAARADDLTHLDSRIFDSAGFKRHQQSDLQGGSISFTNTSGMSSTSGTVYYGGITVTANAATDSTGSGSQEVISQ